MSDKQTLDKQQDNNHLSDVMGTSPCKHENVVSGHSPFVPCYCKDCGQEV